jgi:hypothetical protein
MGAPGIAKAAALRQVEEARLKAELQIRGDDISR